MHYRYPLILILSALAGAWGVWYTVHAAGPVTKPGAESAPLTQPAQPGPWGQLDFSPIYLEAPDNLLASVPKPNSIPRWVFPGADGASLRALFAQAGLPDAMQQRLLDPQRWTVQENNIILFPLVDDLIAMTPQMREIIYPELAKTPENEFHRDPIYIFGGLDDWLRDAGLSAESEALIRKMSYHRGRALAFSDLRTLLHTAKTEAEVQHIFKTATRTRTLVATVRIPPDSDPKVLADYWTGGRPDSDILPLLASVSERSSGTMLDITHLLPPLARRRLYTYPTAELAVRGRLPDCHWTSLNFFSSTRQDYFLDTRLASRRVIENYFTVPAPYRFGDVLFFNNGAGETIHSCVYIAADIVFTKNGENALAPWILMRLSDVQDLYLLEPSSTMQGYREKLTPGQQVSFNP